jgi:hypothetical protein
MWFLHLGANFVKPFTAVIYKWTKEAKVFVPVKPFQSIVLFASKARDHLSIEPEIYSP